MNADTFNKLTTEGAGQPKTTRELFGEWFERNISGGKTEESPADGTETDPEQTEQGADSPEDTNGDAETTAGNETGSKNRYPAVKDGGALPAERTQSPATTQERFAEWFNSIL